MRVQREILIPNLFLPIYLFLLWAEQSNGIDNIASFLSDSNLPFMIQMRRQNEIPVQKKMSGGWLKRRYRFIGEMIMMKTAQVRQVSNANGGLCVWCFGKDFSKVTYDKPNCQVDIPSSRVAVPKNYTYLPPSTFNPRLWSHSDPVKNPYHLVVDL